MSRQNNIPRRLWDATTVVTQNVKKTVTIIVLPLAKVIALDPVTKSAMVHVLRIVVQDVKGAVVGIVKVVVKIHAVEVVRTHVLAVPDNNLI